MRISRIVVVMAWVGLSAGLVFATDFTWNDSSGVNHKWDTCGNWKYPGTPSLCYPANTGDEAIIAALSGTDPWEIDIDLLIDRISRITIHGSVKLSSSVDECLVFNRIIIDPAGGTSDIVVTVDSGHIGTTCTVE